MNASLINSLRDKSFARKARSAQQQAVWNLASDQSFKWCSYKAILALKFDLDCIPCIIKRLDERPIQEDNWPYYIDWIRCWPIKKQPQEKLT